MSDFKVNGSKPSQTLSPQSSSRVLNFDAQNKTKKQKPTPRKNNTKPNEQDSLLFNSLPQLANADIDQRLLADILKQLNAEFFNNQIFSEESIIDVEQEQSKALSDQNIEKLGDMLEKLQKKKSSGLIGKIFGWIGAALGVVLGSVLAVISFGTGAAAAGVLISLSVALAITMVVMTSSGGMDKMTQALAKPLATIFKAMGMDASKAKKISNLVTQITVAVAVVAAQLALAIATGAANAVNFVSELANKIMAIVVKATNFALAADSMASAGADMASGTYNYQALESQADMTENKAFIKKIEVLIEQEKDMIKEIINRLIGVQNNMGKLIKDENENRDILFGIGSQSNSV